MERKRQRDFILFIKVSIHSICVYICFHCVPGLFEADLVKRWHFPPFEKIDLFLLRTYRIRERSAERSWPCLSTAEAEEQEASPRTPQSRVTNVLWRD